MISKSKKHQSPKSRCKMKDKKCSSQPDKGWPFTVEYLVALEKFCGREFIIPKNKHRHEILRKIVGQLNVIGLHHSIGSCRPHFTDQFWKKSKIKEQVEAHIKRVNSLHDNLLKSWRQQLLVYSYLEMIEKSTGQQVLPKHKESIDILRSIRLLKKRLKEFSAHLDSMKHEEFTIVPCPAQLDLIVQLRHIYVDLYGVDFSRSKNKGKVTGVSAKFLNCIFETIGANFSPIAYATMLDRNILNKTSKKSIFS